MKPYDSKWRVNKPLGRAKGSPATIGRVPRIGLAHTDERSRLREDKAPEESKDIERRRVITSWSLGLTCVAVLILVGILGSWIMRRTPQDHPTADSSTSSRSPAIRAVDASSPGPPAEQDALDLVRKALAARDAEAVANFYHPGSHSPERIVGFLGSLAKDSSALRVAWLGSMNANGLLIEGVAVLTAEGDSPRRRLALLTPDGQGVWKVDFDALAETTTPAWAEWQKPGPMEGTMRVCFMPELYFNGKYLEESVWVCYSVYASDAATSCFAYCKRGSEQHRAMEIIRMRYERNQAVNQSQTQVPRAVIAVNRPADNQVRQLEITQVIAEGWIVSAVPFEGKP